MFGAIYAKPKLGRDLNEHAGKDRMIMIVYGGHGFW